MFAWYQRLSASQRRTFWACFGGWGLDAMDFQLYLFVIPSLIALWKITGAQAGLIASATLLASAFGGWFAGILSDRYGRLTILQFTIIWYAIFTFCCGFAQTYEQLLILRTAQGLGFGGEWATGAVLLGEIIQPSDRSKGVGCVQSAYGVGWGMAALSYGIAFSFAPPDLAWRIMFWSGLVPVLLVIYIRLYVREESPVFLNAQLSTSRRGVADRLFALFAPACLMRTILASCLCLGIQGGTLGLLVWLPTFLKNARGLSVIGTTSYSLVITIGSFFGFVAGAYLADAIGRRASFIFWSVVCTIVVVAYTVAPISDAAILVLSFPLGFVVCGIYGGIGAYLTELFPTPIRTTAQAFTYNFGRAMGATVPFAIGSLSSVMPLGQAVAAFAAVSYALVLIAVIFLPETRGADLAQVDADGRTRASADFLNTVSKASR